MNIALDSSALVSHNHGPCVCLYIDRFQWQSTIRGAWPEHRKSVKIVRNKKTLKSSHPTGGYRKPIAKCDVALLDEILEKKKDFGDDPRNSEQTLGLGSQ